MEQVEAGVGGAGLLSKLEVEGELSLHQSFSWLRGRGHRAGAYDRTLLAFPSPTLGEQRLFKGRWRRLRPLLVMQAGPSRDVIALAPTP